MESASSKGVYGAWESRSANWHSPWHLGLASEGLAIGYGCAKVTKAPEVVSGVRGKMGGSGKGLGEDACIEGCYAVSDVGERSRR